MTDLVVREYGRGNEWIIALHGGPAAVGDVAPLARTLGEQWHVLEPYQRGSGDEPLTVATHVQDLDDVIGRCCDESRPILLGHSWGAMLALAYAAAHPTRSAAVALIGCGTFSPTARAEYEARRDAQLTPDGQVIPDAGFVSFDRVAHQQTWTDMVRLQRNGTYPAAFAAIGVPVLMLHGDRDPHPGQTTRDDLRQYIPHLEYLELSDCGHYPWTERQATQRFFAALSAWMIGTFNG